MGFSSPEFVAIAPRLYQVLVSIFYDYFFLLVCRLYDPSASVRDILLVNYLSWPSLTYLSRTVVNASETFLILVAFYFWRKRDQDWRYDWVSRLVTVFCFVVRGTSVMVWMVIWPYELLTMKGGLKQRAVFVGKSLLTVSAMLGASVLSTYIWTGKLQLVEWNFFYVTHSSNIVQPVHEMGRVIRDLSVSHVLCRSGSIAVGWMASLVYQWNSFNLQ